MTQTQFALQRNELIAKYRRSIRPAWEEYQGRLARTHSYQYAWQVNKEFRDIIKPHLELLFARIANLKQQLEANPK